MTCGSAATRAGGLDTRAREALVKYVLRPPVAQERVTAGPDGLVRIARKRPFADGTVALDLDPLSLLARLASSVPAKGTHTVRYAGVLASASKLRSRVVPSPPAAAPTGDGEERKPDKPGCRYRTWTELLATLGIDALACPKCAGRMNVVRLVREACFVATAKGVPVPSVRKRASRPQRSIVSRSAKNATPQ